MPEGIDAVLSTEWKIQRYRLKNSFKQEGSMVQRKFFYHFAKWASNQLSVMNVTQQPSAHLSAHTRGRILQPKKQSKLKDSKCQKETGLN